jgi:hypothetical protein
VDDVEQGHVKVERHPEHRGFWLLTARLWVPRARDEVFPFFSDARNLQELTPSWLDFDVLTEGDVPMRVGATIDYRLKFRGIPIEWRTLIAGWDPPRMFQDTQVKGPYATWEHTHSFEVETRGGVEGTLCGDDVTYRPPFGAFANWLVVERDVKRIFTFRLERMRELFGEPADVRPAAAG